MISLNRTVVLLVGTAIVMLAVVMLRAETARLRRDREKLDREALKLNQAIDAARIELARLRNPAVVRQRASEIVYPTPADGAEE